MSLWAAGGNPHLPATAHRKATGGAGISWLFSSSLGKKHRVREIYTTAGKTHLPSGCFR